MVEQDLLLTMGGLAWAFNIRKKRDPVTGHEIPVHWNDFTPLLIAKPSPFEFDLVPRSEERLRVVRERYRAAVQAHVLAQKDSPMDMEQFRADLGDKIDGDEKAHEDVLVDEAGLGPVGKDK